MAQLQLIELKEQLQINKLKEARHKITEMQAQLDDLNRDLSQAEIELAPLRHQNDALLKREQDVKRIWNFLNDRQRDQTMDIIRKMGIDIRSPLQKLFDRLHGYRSNEDDEL